MRTTLLRNSLPVRSVLRAPVSSRAAVGLVMEIPAGMGMGTVMILYGPVGILLEFVNMCVTF